MNKNDIYSAEFTKGIKDFLEKNSTDGRTFNRETVAEGLGLLNKITEMTISEEKDLEKEAPELYSVRMSQKTENNTILNAIGGAISLGTISGWRSGKGSLGIHRVNEDKTNSTNTTTTKVKLPIGFTEKVFSVLEEKVKGKKQAITVNNLAKEIFNKFGGDSLTHQKHLLQMKKDKSYWEGYAFRQGPGGGICWVGTPSKPANSSEKVKTSSTNHVVASPPVSNPVTTLQKEEELEDEGDFLQAAEMRPVISVNSIDELRETNPEFFDEVTNDGIPPQLDVVDEDVILQETAA